MSTDPSETTPLATNFIRDIVEADVADRVYDGTVVTRFPPEPNGYLHIGHAYAASVSFEIAKRFGGTFNLRFDDTNPQKENVEFVESQKRDLRWLGFDWGENLFFASDYFPKMHEYAVQLIEQGKAYVCELSPDETRAYRGTFTEPGRNSPYRDRSVQENMELFAKMTKGELPEGAAVLRAKIDMASPNVVMRDPVMYRIQHHPHYRAGERWKIYPIYDWAHCLEDSIEGVTHSLCSLEFENNRALYDWYLEQLDVHHPKQLEFSRMSLSHTVLGKRKLMMLVDGGHVWGWDDPRLPTVSGMRRRGYTPEAIRAFLRTLGVTKSPLGVDIGNLVYYVRKDLNERARRVMAVLRPLKVVIDNYPEGHEELLEAENNPEDPAAGTRTVPFSKVLYIERDDFALDPPKKYFRLAPGMEVRLKHAYFVRCVDVVQDASGEVIEVHCTYDPDTRGGQTPPDGRKVKGTLHWVSAAHAVEADVRLFDPLFLQERPDNVPEGKTLIDLLNPNSLEVLRGCRVEPSLRAAAPGEPLQFIRHGYFCADAKDSSPGAPVFNRTVELKDSWAKQQNKE